MHNQDFEELVALMKELNEKSARYDFLCRHHAQGLGALLGFSGKTPTTREIAERIDLFLNPLGGADLGAQ